MNIVSRYIPEAIKNIGLLFYSIIAPVIHPPSSHEKKLAIELKKKFEAIKASGEAESSVSNPEWKKYMGDLYQNVMNEKIYAFLRWKVIRGTMFIGNSGYIKTELSSLKSSKSWNSRLSDAIIESDVGRPRRLTIHAVTTGSLVHHAYHVDQFEKHTGEDVNNFDRVLEFGGGYGSMCRLFHKLKFDGLYVIYDLPYFSALQNYYLSALGFKTIDAQEAKAGKKGIVCTSKPSDIKMLFEDQPCEVPQKGLFIATWSISESPESIRKEIEGSIESMSHIFIAYQEKFEDIDNIKYFDGFRSRLHQYSWQTWPINHLAGNHYTIGVNNRKLN